MRRRLFSILTLASLLMLAATCVAWRISHTTAYGVWHARGEKTGQWHRTVRVLAQCGRVRVVADRTLMEPRSGVATFAPEAGRPGVLEDFDLNVRFPGLTIVQFPHYAPAALFSLLPLRWLWLRLRPPRVRPGFEVELAASSAPPP